MNDRRFLELLNLYLDYQIGPDEAAELEAVVYQDPDRRRVYEDYCRLQRGCNLLGNSTRAAATSSTRFSRSLQQAERKIAAPRWSYRRHPVQVGAWASLALAACVAMMVLTNRPESAPTGTLAPASNLPPNSARVVASAVSHSSLVTQSPTVRFGPQASLVSMNLRTAQNSLDPEPITDDPAAVAWMQRVDQLPRLPLIVDEQVFAVRTMVPPDARVLSHSHSSPNAAEFTRFEVQH